MWTELTVVATPADGGKPARRSGHTLTILRKDGGRWKIARDANMLS
jgi:ketosteroid isomerase-like protein